MIPYHIMVKGINLRMFAAWLFLGCFLAVLMLAPAAPALAQTATPEVAAAAPAGTPPPEEKKETAPSTGGPMITDTTIPIDTGHVSPRCSRPCPSTRGPSTPTGGRRTSGVIFTPTICR